MIELVTSQLRIGTELSCLLLVWDTASFLVSYCCISFIRWFICTPVDIEQNIEDEKKKQQELDAQIREMEKKVKEEHNQNGDRKRSAKKAGGQKQNNTRKLEDQLQLVSTVIVASGSIVSTSEYSTSSIVIGVKCEVASLVTRVMTTVLLTMSHKAT